MSNNIFSQFKQPAPVQQQAPDFDSAYRQFMQNPMQALSGKYSIPTNLQSNPQGIVQHLLQSGQISQQQLEEAQQIAGQLFGKR